MVLSNHINLMSRAVPNYRALEKLDHTIIEAVSGGRPFGLKVRSLPSQHRLSAVYMVTSGKPSVYHILEIETNLVIITKSVAKRIYCIHIQTRIQKENILIKYILCIYERSA